MPPTTHSTQPHNALTASHAAHGITGVLLAGGRGSRLDPVTRVLNKHLLPVYDRPMLLHGLHALRTAGIRHTVVVTNGPDIAAMQAVVGEASSHGLKSVTYIAQRGPGGVADALLSAEPAVQTDTLWIMLGDNLFGRSLQPTVERFARCDASAMLLLHEVNDEQALRSMGVARFEGERLCEVLEKPAVPPSRAVVVGAYGYRQSVFDICRTLVPSARGELEITDLNNALLCQAQHDAGPAVGHAWIDGWWSDAGTFASLHEAGERVRQHGVNVP